MTKTHKITFTIITGLIFLLPIFFIPGGALFLNSAKGTLLAFALVAAALAFVWESSRTGTLSLHWHAFLGAALILPLAYLVSALFSAPSSMSLFGYELEVGTFAYIALGSALLILSAQAFADRNKVLWGIIAAFASLLLIVLYSSVKVIFGGEAISLGMFFGNMASPVGRWTDIAIAASLAAILSLLAVNMSPAKRGVKVFLYAAFAISTALMVVANFSLAFGLSLFAAIFIFVYFSTIESRFAPAAPGRRNGKMVLPIILMLVSLLFIINPVVTSSGRAIGDITSSAFGVANTDVRPSFASTLNISASVLKENPILGSGPNTFGRDWLAYKPGDINSTLFWNVSFPFGIGFVPTQLATTGLLGALAWIAFFLLFLALGKRTLSHMPDSRLERFALVSSFLSALVLWIASFFYAPSMPLLSLAFAFSGLFVASARISESIPAYKFNFKEVPAASFIATLVAVAVVSGFVVLGFSAFQKIASAYYYKKAIDLSNTPDTSVETVEEALVKAIGFSPSDIYLTSLSQLNFSKAQAFASNQSGDPEENRAKFEESLSRSIAAARAATESNPGSYQNWMALGSIYAALVPEPLNVEGAYESAQAAYAEAARRNPVSPEVPLMRARLEMARGEVEAARGYIQESVSLKPDYPDAYFALAQLEVSQNNISEAIRSAETGALLSPQNPGLYFEIGLLKYSNNDFEGARASFSQALEIVPEYANAKYYLGLSLAELGRDSEALSLFEELAMTNPESQEVSLIVENLRAGRDALEGLPISASDVEERQAPPISNVEQ